ncbi:hypothetical protein GO988_20525 [Hymenobacter sp. HMF4947]|uniref:Uncharacterized protein n=1 Tax=Hymenobacter ginkgonis TaxID=2682976 RepID=A0A7K1TK67_9BACT|nr:hypothetical protein [Hymenobacter ginkgonis]MVN78726.1 hypothetical protein [Hymenobacter ginkgonis]
MNLFRLTLTMGGLGLLASGLSSCLSEPTYSSTPVIEFASINPIRVAPKVSGGQPVDSVLITIRYQDGDGDLGLSAADQKLPQYTFPSRFSKNYFIEPLLKVGNKYQSLATIDSLAGNTAYVRGGYYGTFDRITSLTDNKSAPIKGTLTRNINFGYGDVFTAGQTVRFRVSIADRALHVSNVITTDSIVIKPR